jgi:hypothetical protein
MINSKKTGDERRQNYRITYPPDFQPRIVIKEHEFDILDLSETGLRFSIKSNVRLPGDLFRAQVKLHNGTAVEIMGRIIRVTGEDAAMFLVVKKIPYQIILSEQAFLRQESQS